MRGRLLKTAYKIAVLFSAMLLLFSCALIVSAHPGRTDSSGGHHNRSTGGYHYHHGYPAHQHVNGVCPYEYDDKTGWNSDSYSNSNNFVPAPTSTPKTTPIPTPEPAPDTTQENSTDWVGIALTALCLGWPALYLIPCLLPIKSKRQETSATQALPAAPSRQNRRAQQLADLRYEKEYTYYFDLYAFYNPADFVTMPKGAYLRDEIPVTSNKGTYGLYTVYITKTGTKYHQSKDCVNTKMIKTHILNVRGFQPCAKCAKQEIPDLNWYFEYRRISKIKKKYELP